MREAREEKEAHASKHQNNFGSIDRCGRAPRKVRRQAHPAEDWQDSWAPVQTSPRTLGEFDPCGQIRPQRFFSFPRKGDAASLSGERALWRVFSFSARRKGAPAGAQRSGSGGERRKERSLSGIFGVSRKCSGGVSSDEDRARPAKVSREAARGPSGGFSLFLRAEKGPPPEPSEAGPVGRGGRNGA